MTSAFSNARIQHVIERFGTAVLGRTSVCMEFEAFLHKIGFASDAPTVVGRRDLIGSHCLEIGTFHGISTMILAQYFEKVTAITLEPSHKTDLMMKYRVWKEVGATNIEAILIKDNREKAELLANLDFDFAYLDGNHDEDTQTDFDLTKRCGRILFHEYWPLQPPVWKLVNGLIEAKTGTVLKASYDCLAYWEANRAQETVSA